MTRINLLPPERIKERKRAPRAPGAPGRSYAWLLIVLPLIVLVAMGYWWFSMNSKINEKNKAVKAANEELADWQAKSQQLQQYKGRQEEIKTIEQTVVTALAGRVYWARILNEIAIMCPSNVWLSSLNGTSSGGTSGTVDFQGYALQCPNRHLGGMYRWYPDYRPVANWLDRMAQIVEFQRIWLGSAEPTRQGTSVTTEPPAKTVTGEWVIGFSSQATLNMKTATIGGAPAAPTASSTTPSSTTPSTAPSTPSPTTSPTGKAGGETR